MRSTIICVDDEKVLLNVLSEQLEAWFGNNYIIEKALNGPECLEIIDSCIEEGRDVSVVISDYIMPVMRGDELLEKVKEKDPKIKKIMLTGYSSIEGIIHAINKAGLYRFISKPWDNKDLMLTLLEAIKSYEHEKITAELAHKYETLNQKYQSIEDTANKSVNSMMEVLVSAVDNRSSIREGHSKRVAQFAGFLGNALRLGKEELKILNQAAMLHDIGKINLSDEELEEIKNCRLDNISSSKIRQKQAENAKLLLQSLPNYEKIFEAVKYQYEEFIGSGPFNKAGVEIPLYSRIIAIANQFDWLKNKPEKLGLTEIVSILEDDKDILFDPKLVDLFVKIVKPSF